MKTFLKHLNKEVFPTGKTKKRGPQILVQVLDPWTKEDNEAFKDFWGYERPQKDDGLHRWVPEYSLERR